jgi:hypothetical protein
MACRLGLLALVLGNGDLQVVAVPHPKAALQGLDPISAHQVPIAASSMPALPCMKLPRSLLGA